jgi:nucleotide-binding universal stress UspA family protein
VDGTAPPSTTLTEEVMVGTDGSGSVLGAVERAADIAGPSGALVLAVCAYSAMTHREQPVAVSQLGDTRFDQVIGEEAPKRRSPRRANERKIPAPLGSSRDWSRATPCTCCCRSPRSGPPT